MNLSDKKGFTLIEVLVAVTIVSIGLMAIAGMQSTAISGSRSANDLTIAIQLAEEMVERIRINGGGSPEGYNGIDTSNSCAGSDPALGDCTQWKNRLAEANSGILNAVGTITVTADSPASDMAKVIVTVTWGNSGVIGLAGQRSITFTTIVETVLT